MTNDEILQEFWGEMSHKFNLVNIEELKDSKYKNTMSWEFKNFIIIKLMAGEISEKQALEIKL